MHPIPAHERFEAQLKACINAVFTRKKIDGTTKMTLHISLESMGVQRLSKALLKKVNHLAWAWIVKLSYAPVGRGFNVSIDLDTVRRTAAQAAL